VQKKKKFLVTVRNSKQITHFQSCNFYIDSILLLRLFLVC